MTSTRELWRDEQAKRTRPRFRIHSMHGPTVYAFDEHELALAIRRLTEQNDPRRNSGPYRLLDEQTGKTLTWAGWQDSADLRFGALR